MHSCFHDTRRSVIATRCDKGKLPFRSTFACAVASLDYERHRRCRSGRRRCARPSPGRQTWLRGPRAETAPASSRQRGRWRFGGCSIHPQMTPGSPGMMAPHRSFARTEKSKAYPPKCQQCCRSSPPTLVRISRFRGYGGGYGGTRCERA
jgi:hypothetical protein